MENYVNLHSMGLVLVCPNCKEILDLSSVDIDEEIKSHNPNTFDLSICCLECDYQNEFRIEMKVI